MNNQIVSQADYSIFLVIVNTHYETIDQFMVLLTIYGRGIFVLLVIIIVLLTGKKGGRKIAALTILVMIILIPIGMLAKEITEQPRPTIPEFDFLIAADSEFAFPSGHALMVSGGAAITIALFRNSYKDLRIAILLTTEAGLVCFSRVYVGGHYPLDVLGGIL